MTILAGDHPSESVKVRRSPLASKKFNQSAMTGKRCKIGGRLVLITNRKAYYELSIGTRIGDLE